MTIKQEKEEGVDAKDLDSNSDQGAATAAVPDATQKQGAKRRTKTGCLSESGLFPCTPSSPMDSWY